MSPSGGMAHDRSGDPEASWIQRAADLAIAHAPRSSAKVIVCASGISPSGPIHLGNLREVMTAHLVAEEIKARGIEAVHVHSWDDYDRFRRVPAGLPEEWSRHIGTPLAAVPDPYGGSASYAEHFMGEFTAALGRLGVRMREIRQSRQYPAGRYNTSIRQALDLRGRIFDIVEQFQTEGRHERSVAERRRAYFPFKPYCSACGKDFTEVIAWDGDGVDYRCRCGHEARMTIADGAQISGKLVWKVDWPMRWAFEGVDFEPAGEDHHAPSSSFASGRVLAPDIFGVAAPASIVYSFVGLAGGKSKMSGSSGGAATPDTALDLLEPPMVRWLYARRVPAQSFTIDLSPPAILRLYDEWDRFVARVERGSASTVEQHLYRVCVRTSAGQVERSARPVSFRLLSSAADITDANPEQIERLVRQHIESDSGAALSDNVDLLAELEPRLADAIGFARALPPEDRTIIRTDFNIDRWSNLDEKTREGVRMLAARMSEDWTLAGLTKSVYAVPKLLEALPEDAEPTPQLKKAQRTFFTALYQLLCSRETGPRLPTLLLSIGPIRARTLFTPPEPHP